MKLIAAKSLTYDTRRLKAGDTFDATDMHARILVGIRKARYASEQEEAPKRVTRVVVPEPEPEDDGAQILAKLRAQAERLGIVVDGRWGPARLQSEIALANRK